MNFFFARAPVRPSSPNGDARMSQWAEGARAAAAARGAAAGGGAGVPVFLFVRLYLLSSPVFLLFSFNYSLVCYTTYVSTNILDTSKLNRRSSAHGVRDRKMALNWGARRPRHEFIVQTCAGDLEVFLPGSSS